MTVEEPRKDERPAGNGANILRADKTNHLDQFTAVYRLSPEATAWLHLVVDALTENRVSLGQLPLPLVALYWLGTIQGGCSHDVAAWEHRTARLEFEADYWYFRHANPRADFYRHAESELWRQGVAA